MLPTAAYAAPLPEGDQTLTAAGAVECSDEYPSGILISNPASNTASFFVASTVSDSSGTKQFGDGGILEPGESIRVASAGPAVTVEDAVYTYSVSQSVREGKTDAATEPFIEVASGSYGFDCVEDPAYFVTRYDGTVWAVTASSIVPLSYDDWRDAGFPSPVPAPTDYVKYRWSSTISAVTFFGTPEDRWIWQHVSLSEWTRAGKPAPRAAGWIKDSLYYRWGTASQIFVQDVGGVKHALSYAEWELSGFRPFESRDSQGFARLSWDGNIAFMQNLQVGQGAPISYETWSTEGFPSPLVAARFPGDTLYRNYGSPTIYYAGPTVNRAISYAEWSGLGRPDPVVLNVPPRPPVDKDCRDYSSQQAAQAEFAYFYPAYGDVYRLDEDSDGTACEYFFR